MSAGFPAIVTLRRSSAPTRRCRRRSSGGRPAAMLPLTVELRSSCAWRRQIRRVCRRQSCAWLPETVEPIIVSVPPVIAMPPPFDAVLPLTVTLVSSRIAAVKRIAAARAGRRRAGAIAVADRDAGDATRGDRPCSGRAQHAGLVATVDERRARAGAHDRVGREHELAAHREHVVAGRQVDRVGGAGSGRHRLAQRAVGGVAPACRCGRRSC